MKWATRARVHVDRAACAWLIRRFIDPDAEFVFVTDPSQVPPETALASFDLTADPALEEIGRIVHQADLSDDRYDAPAAAGLDIVIRGLTLTSPSDDATLAVTDRIFDALYEHTRRQLMTGRPPA